MNAIEQQQEFARRFARQRQISERARAREHAMRPVQRRIRYSWTKLTPSGRKVSMDRLYCGHDVLSSGNAERSPCVECGRARARAQGWPV